MLGHERVRTETRVILGEDVELVLWRNNHTGGGGSQHSWAWYVTLEGNRYGRAVGFTFASGDDGLPAYRQAVDDADRQIGAYKNGAQLTTLPLNPKAAHPEPLPEPPIPLLLWCPGCGERHVDRGQWATRPHRTHACQNCGMCWRPAVQTTVGVQFLPGFQDDTSRPLGT